MSRKWMGFVFLRKISSVNFLDSCLLVTNGPEWLKRYGPSAEEETD
jgi:hypothetical protein